MPASRAAGSSRTADVPSTRGKARRCPAVRSRRQELLSPSAECSSCITSVRGARMTTTSGRESSSPPGRTRVFGIRTRSSWSYGRVEPSSGSGSLDVGPVGLARYGGRLSEIVAALGRHGFGEWARLAAATRGVGGRPLSAAEHADRQALGPRRTGRCGRARPGRRDARADDELPAGRRRDRGGIRVGDSAAVVRALRPARRPRRRERRTRRPRWKSRSPPSAPCRSPQAPPRSARRHAARGRDVVLKVLHDGVERRVREDLVLMGAVARSRRGS